MYFPKSQITTNLYTNGNEFIYPDSSTYYLGYYFQTSNGKYYTGRNPNDAPVQEIIIEVDPQTEDAEEGAAGSYTPDTNLYLVPDIYAQNINLGLESIPPSPPISIANQPTEGDYELGEFQRYFASKVNEVKYVEIDLNQFTKFENEEPNVDYPLYNVYSLPWLISGKRNDVYNINQKTVERIQNNNLLSGFKSYFKNVYDQYFRYSPGENLKTDGSEFLIERSNKPYIGLYHIHPTKGPMVGAEHTNIPHDYLIPVSGSNIQYKINKTETQRSNRMGGGY